MTERELLIAKLRHEGLTVTEWSDPADTAYDVHAHVHREVRVVLAGEITFVVGAEEVRLGPGDRIDLAAGELHGARVGAGGVTYLSGTER